MTWYEHVPDELSLKEHVKAAELHLKYALDLAYGDEYYQAPSTRRALGRAQSTLISLIVNNKIRENPKTIDN
jgi:hypothetical protein